MSLPEGLVTPRRSGIRTARLNGTLAVGLLGALSLLVLAAWGPAWAPYDPQEQHVLEGVLGVRAMRAQPPSQAFPLGTDHAGRDVLSGLLAGARYTLLYLGLVVVLQTFLGVAAGLWAGWSGGRPRALLETVAAAVGSAPPLVAAGLGLIWVHGAMEGAPPVRGVALAALVLAALGAPRFADTVRRLVEQVRVEPFVASALAAGARTPRILSRYLLPNLAPQLAVAVLLEAAALLRLLALLGLLEIFLVPVEMRPLAPDQVVEPPREWVVYPVVPEWTSYLRVVAKDLRSNWWLLVYPGLAITYAVATFHLLAEGLRRQWRLKG